MPVTVNDDDLVAELGAEAGVLLAVDADVGTHVIAAADFRPPVTKPGPVGGHAAAHDGDQASARLEPQEGLLDVAGSEGGAVSVDSAAGGREGRVHHDGMISFFQGEEIVETFGIECRGLRILAGRVTHAGVGRFHWCLPVLQGTEREPQYCPFRHSAPGPPFPGRVRLL